MRPSVPKSLRLRFDTWRPEDLDLAVALWGDPEVTRLIDRRPQLTREEVGERLETERSRQAELGVQYWPMFTRSPPDDDGDERALDRFVGVAGLQPSALGPFELGFHLRKAFWGKGFAREATQAVIDYVFDVIGHAELVAGHHPDNKASQSVLERLGFVFSHEALFPPTGLMHPWYRLSAEAWAAHNDG